jgi:hypothetical protein
MQVAELKSDRIITASLAEHPPGEPGLLHGIGLVPAKCRPSWTHRRNRDRCVRRCRRLCGFRTAITADYDAQSAVERELVLRLASLLWRLRRATAIESGLFKIQAKQLLQVRQRRQAH